MKVTYIRGIRTVCMAIIVVCMAHAGIPQSSIQSSQQIRDHLQRAQKALQTKDEQTAEAEFRAILELDPKNAVAHTDLGVLLIGRGDCRAASGEFHTALAFQPSLTKAQALLGVCQKRMGDPAARDTLEKAFQKLREKPLRIQVGMELAGLYDREGNLDRAVPVMQTLVGLDPDSVDVLFMAQRIYSELADDTLNKLAVVAPASARMQQVIAQRLINAGDLNAAIEHYRRALEIDPRLPGVRYELGEAILEDSRSDPGAQAEAEKEFAAAVATEGDNAKIECQLGRLAFQRSDLEQSDAHYSRALALNPNEVDAQLGLAKLLLTKDKPREAMKYLRMAVQADPLNAEAHYRLSTVYRKLG